MIISRGFSADIGIMNLTLSRSSFEPEIGSATGAAMRVKAWLKSSKAVAVMNFIFVAIFKISIVKSSIIVLAVVGFNV